MMHKSVFVGLLMILLLLVSGCQAGPTPTRTTPSPQHTSIVTQVVSKSSPSTPTQLPSSPSLTPCVNAASPTTVTPGPGPEGETARLGTPLANFVIAFGPATECTRGRVEFTGPNFTVNLPNSSPVRSLWVTALPGLTWNRVDEDRICEGFFPPNPNLITTLDQPYREFYSTDEGDIVYLPKDGLCAMQFTEA